MIQIWEFECWRVKIARRLLINLEDIDQEPTRAKNNCHYGRGFRSGRGVFYSTRHHRTRRAGRAALRMDRAGDGANARLGDAAPLWAAVVREAGSLLLGGWNCISISEVGGNCGAIAFGDRRAAGCVRHRMVCAESNTAKERHGLP